MHHSLKMPSMRCFSSKIIFLPAHRLVHNQLPHMTCATQDSAGGCPHRKKAVPIVGRNRANSSCLGDAKICMRMHHGSVYIHTFVFYAVGSEASQGTLPEFEGCPKVWSGFQRRSVSTHILFTVLQSCKLSFLLNKVSIRLS